MWPLSPSPSHLLFWPLSAAEELEQSLPGPCDSAVPSPGEWFLPELILVLVTSLVRRELGVSFSSAQCLKLPTYKQTFTPPSLPLSPLSLATTGQFQPPSVFVNDVLGTQPSSFLSILSSAAFPQWPQSIRDRDLVTYKV